MNQLTPILKEIQVIGPNKKSVIYFEDLRMYAAKYFKSSDLELEEEILHAKNVREILYVIDNYDINAYTEFLDQFINDRMK